MSAVSEQEQSLYSVIVDMNRTLGQTLQLAQGTKDDVGKIKDVQTKQVTDQAQFQTLLSEFLKDHDELKKKVTDNHVELTAKIAVNTSDIKVLQDDHLVRNKAIKWIIILWGGVISIVGWLVVNWKAVKDFFSTDNYPTF